MRAIWIAGAITLASLSLDPPATAHRRPSKVKVKVKVSQSMQPGFSKAQASFRDHAARQLKLTADRVLVSPSEEDPIVQLEQRIGGAWAFYGSSREHPDRSLRGWAVADGTVITPEQNLGLLLREAGVWSATPSLDAGALAARLVWALGIDHRLVGESKLQLDGKGAGTLKFQSSYRPPGPGGAGGGPGRISQRIVTLTADQRAQLTTLPVQPVSSPIE